jgi:hypothetical protein
LATRHMGVNGLPEEPEELEELEELEKIEEIEELESVDSEAVPDRMAPAKPGMGTMDSRISGAAEKPDPAVRLEDLQAILSYYSAQLPKQEQAGLSQAIDTGIERLGIAMHSYGQASIGEAREYDISKEEGDHTMDKNADSNPGQNGYATRDYIKSRKKLSGLFFETALPNEYLVEVGRKEIRPRLGGRRFRLFRKFLRVPASVQTLNFTTDNANMDYQGIGIEGYASWRIDPEHPDLAIKTLDFFDEDDPMARTNAELRTICVEAVRHVISNMTIDDALKKKDEIADNLSRQLKGIERKWGIIFDQVGIEKVRIMSHRLFEQLQAQFRDGLRLEVERKRITTDRQIAAEQNAMREGTGLESIMTNQKLALSQVEQKSRVEEAEAAEAHRLALQKLELDRAAFREEQSFRIEKEKEGHALAILGRTLSTELAAAELRLLNEQSSVEEVKARIGERQLALQRLQREVSQIFSDEALAAEFIQRLPALYSALKIDNYTVLDSGSGQISPVTRVLSEVAAALKGLDLKGLFGGAKAQD